MTREISSERFRDRFDQFNEIGATERGGVNRPALSDANKRARDELVEWFEEVGLEVTVDEMGNVFGRREGRNNDLAPVLVGSHIDSQYNGGRYDGVIGVLGALEGIETLNDADVETERPIEVVSWTNEEGVRFQPDMLGSGVFAGKFDTEFAYSLEDKEGKRFGDELERIGYRGDTPCEPRDLHSYFELHVEQGPKLEDVGLSVGVVEGVYGFIWFDAAFTGSADHAGPTPMHLRYDALVATSDVIEAVRRIAGTEGDDLVGTVGSLDVSPNSINVIPERVDFTVDFRSYDDATVDRAAERVCREIDNAASRENVDSEYEQIMRIDSQSFDDDCVETVAAAADALDAEYTRLVSGAGHDASYLNGVCPTAMVFAPSVGGVSHTEDEYTEWEDVVTATNVLFNAALEKAKEGHDSESTSNSTPAANAERTESDSDSP